MKRIELHELVMTGLFAGFVTVATMTTQIPLPETKGFLNFGDAIIFVAALLFGRRVGFLSGALGSALADLLTGYAVWAPWTFAIKGFEGFIAGALGHDKGSGKIGGGARPAGALALAAFWMVLGYFIASVILYGYPVALAGIPTNLIQGYASAFVALPVASVISRVSNKSAKAGR